MTTVESIMQRDVVTVGPDTTVRRLTRLLADEGISGVPVVSGDGELVGVVSATDVVRLAAEDADVRLASARARPPGVVTQDPEDEPPGEAGDPHGYFLPEDAPFAGEDFLEQFPESEFDSVRVADIMTPVSFTVAPDTPVKELADFLVRGRIHRAVVVDEERLVGIVTSGDVLRAVAGGVLN